MIAQAVWLELWRAIVIGIGAYTLGLATYISFAYFRQTLWPDRPYNTRGHVVAIIISYVMLVGVLLIEVTHRAIDHVPVTWRLPVGTIAFPLGAYALTQLVKNRAKEPHEKEE